MLNYVGHVTVVTLIFCLLQTTSARSATNSNTNNYQHANSVTEDNESSSQAQQTGSSSSTSPSNVWKDLSMVYRLYQQCSAENLSICLKVKLLTGLEKVFRSAKKVKIMEGIQFVKADDTEVPTKPILSEQELEANLPRALEAKEQVLTNMIFKNLAGFLQHHTLQIKFPDIRPDDSLDANTVEGRKKKDKKGGGGAYIMIPLLLGGTFVPIAYGALAMLAGKALIVSKLALVLASIIGIKKLLSGGGKESSHEVVVSSGGHSGWGRDFDLAYSGWKPKDGKKAT
ncbi:osiris 8 [Cochliomyia hominivorax]